jgi:hypothetical protein
MVSCGWVSFSASIYARSAHRVSEMAIPGVAECVAPSRRHSRPRKPSIFGSYAHRSPRGRVSSWANIGDGGLVSTAPEDSPPVNRVHHITQSHGVANVQAIGCDDRRAEARSNRGRGGADSNPHCDRWKAWPRACASGSASRLPAHTTRCRSHRSGPAQHRHAWALDIGMTDVPLADSEKANLNSGDGGRDRDYWWPTVERSLRLRCRWRR